MIIYAPFETKCCLLGRSSFDEFLEFHAVFTGLNCLRNISFPLCEDISMTIFDENRQDTFVLTVSFKKKFYSLRIWRNKLYVVNLRKKEKSKKMRAS